MVWLYVYAVNNYRMDLDNIGNIVTNNDQLNLETRENLAISNITQKIFSIK